MEFFQTVLPFFLAYGILSVALSTVTFFFFLRPRGSRKSLPFILASSLLFGTCWWFMLPVFSLQKDDS